MSLHKSKHGCVTKQTVYDGLTKAVFWGKETVNFLKPNFGESRLPPHIKLQPDQKKLRTGWLRRLEGFEFKNPGLWETVTMSGSRVVLRRLLATTGQPILRTTAASNREILYLLLLYDRHCSSNSQELSLEAERLQIRSSRIVTYKYLKKFSIDASNPWKSVPAFLFH